MSEQLSAEGVYTALTDFIQEDDFVCLGAKAALRRSTVIHHHYAELGSPASASEHLRDVYAFLETFEPSARSFTSFVATFDGPSGGPGDGSPDSGGSRPPLTEEAYEEALWTHLQAMHERDRTRHAWCAEYDADPASPRFAYSLAGHPFFVVGLHPGASRPSRRFVRPALVFNSHIQFNALGIRFFKLRLKIRKRERAFHGSVNPSFLAYKDEARHYGGRMTETEWRCPFTAGQGPQA